VLVNGVFIICCYGNRIPVPMEWNGKVVTEEVSWFQYESDPALNSNVYDIAQTLVLKHFPGESHTLPKSVLLSSHVNPIFFPCKSYRSSQVNLTFPKITSIFFQD